MKPAVPREIVDPSRGFEKDNWRARGRGRVVGNASCNARDLEIVKPADESALDALSEEFVEHGNWLPNLISKFHKAD